MCGQQVLKSASASTQSDQSLTLQLISAIQLWNQSTINIPELHKIPWLRCSKLTISLVNVSLQDGIYTNIFVEKICKSYSHFSAKIPVYEIFYLLEQIIF